MKSNTQNKKIEAITEKTLVGRTKEVRISGDRENPGGSRRLAAIEGRVYTRPCRTEMKTFYFVYPEAAISVPDISKYP